MTTLIPPVLLFALELRGFVPNLSAQEIAGRYLISGEGQGKQSSRKCSGGLENVFSWDGENSPQSQAVLSLVNQATHVKDHRQHPGSECLRAKMEMSNDSSKISGKHMGCSFKNSVVLISVPQLHRFLNCTAVYTSKHCFS